MGNPLLFVENFLSVRQFPDHLITAKSEPTGHEAFRVGDGRRSAFDFWTHDTPNDEAWVKVDCAIARTGNMYALDRGHNLGGKTVVGESSSDDFGLDTVQLFSSVIPTTSASGSPDAANGVLTPEGAWLKRFTASTKRYFRLRIPAMGAGLAPQLVGLWIGEHYAPSALRLPSNDNVAALVAQITDSEYGWTGAGAGALRREGALAFKLTDITEYDDQVRHHIEQLFLKRRPMWIVRDDAKADRAVLAIPAPGPQGLDQRTPDWFFPSGEIRWVEHEPQAA